MCVPERVDSKKKSIYIIKMELSEKKLKTQNITQTIYLSLLVSLNFFPRATDLFFFTTERRFPEKTREFSFSRPKEPMLLWTDIFREMGKRRR